MVVLLLAMAVSLLCFFGLILFLVLAHWMSAMALSRLFFLGLILCLVPMTPCETMLYWPHTSALVAYNGGTNVGHGRVIALFLDPDFIPSATLDVGHSLIRTLFLGLILCPVPMTPRETVLYWPSPN